jgi:hypothetical protein
MLIDRTTVVRSAEGAALHAAILAAGLGAATLWAAYCQRRRPM